jgi:GNAT superfamily N-acetyltransferase
LPNKRTTIRAFGALAAQFFEVFARRHKQVLIGGRVVDHLPLTDNRINLIHTMPDLRPASPEDAATIAALIRLCFTTQSVPVDPPASARLETADSVAAHFAAGGGGIVSDDLRAAALWSEKAGGLYVGRLSVHPTARRQGRARRLIEAAEIEARRRGLPRIHLATRLVLLDNRRLFAACGFVETAQHAHPGYAAPTFVEMEKRLI